MYRIRIDSGGGGFAVARHTAAEALATLREMREDNPEAVVFSREGRQIEDDELERRAADAASHVYVSSNGDRWILEVGPDGDRLVRHVGNPASGGHVTEWPADEFLSTRPTGPQHAALQAWLDELR